MLHILLPPPVVEGRESRRTGHSSAGPDRIDQLTPRETEVLRRLASGDGTTTVRNHLQNVLHKLAVHSRLEAVLTLQRRGG